MLAHSTALVTPVGQEGMHVERGGRGTEGLRSIIYIYCCAAAVINHVMSECAHGVYSLLTLARKTQGRALLLCLLLCALSRFLTAAVGVEGLSVVAKFSPYLTLICDI